MNILDVINKGNEAKITRLLDLGDFDEAYRGATFDVWVMPTRAHVMAWGDVVEAYKRLEGKLNGLKEAEKEAAADRIMAMENDWYAEMWINVPVDEVAQIREALPDLAWRWLTQQTTEMPGEFRREKLKN